MAYFGTNMQKVNKIDAPLLVVGLGGTGADGVLRIKSEFSQRLVADRLGSVELDRPPRTAYLVIDTDESVKGKRYHGVSINPDEEWFSLACDVSHLLGNQGQHLEPHMRSWLDKRFYSDENLIRDAATSGAGTYRQLSRLMLFRRAQDLSVKLQAILTRLKTIPAGAPVGAHAINVVVVSGLSGGTGSGSFLDFAYLLRHAAATANVDVKVELYAVAPDVTINNHAASDISKQEIYKTNSFGAFKELDYWMSFDRRRVGEHRDEKIFVDYGNGVIVEWNRAPYDDVTLLCATNSDGALLENAYQVVMASMAETLLFMMAEEANRGEVINRSGADFTANTDSYSFQSAKSNEYAYRQAIQRRYPQNYCYRAVGAYSNLGEQRNKVSIEADLLFSDVNQFINLPTNLPNMLSSAPERFFAPMQDLLLHQFDDLTTATRFNEEMFTGSDSWAPSVLKATDATLAPHGDVFTEWEKNVLDRTAELQMTFKNELYAKFEEICKEYVMTNGPEALRIMLSDPDHGIISLLENKAKSFSIQKDDFRAEYNNALNAASENFIEFHNLDFLANLLRGGQVFNAYITQARSMYVAKQNEIYCDIESKLIKLLATDVRTQIVDRNLKFTMEALESIRKEVESDVRGIPVNAGNLHLVDLQEVKEQIREQYEAENNRVTLMNTVLRSVSDAAVRFTDDGDRDDTADMLIGQIDNMISVIYRSINDMTLQSELSGFNDINDAAVADYVRTQIAPQLERGAKAHFALTSAYGGLNTTNAVLSSYISIPIGAQQVKQGIANYINTGSYSGSVIKNSAIDDRIFWMNIVAGLPLCAYSFLAEYEKVYEKQRHMRPGTHLVTMNDEDLAALRIERSILNDWNLLPSPNPFKLLGSRPVPENILFRWNKAEEVMKEAEKVGIIAFDTNMPSVSDYRAYMHLFSIDTEEAKNELKGKIDSVKAGVGSADEKVSALKELLAERNQYDIIDDVRASEQTETFSTALGVAGVYQGDVNARKACFRELAFYRLSQRPIILNEISEQIEFVKAVQEAIVDVQEGHNEVLMLKEATKTVARWILYNCVKMRLTNVLYYNALGELETNGESNKLFSQDMSLNINEAWCNFVPLKVRLVEWYAKQVQTEEPFASINETMKERYQHSIDPDDTAEDIALCIKYRTDATELAAAIDRDIVNLKAHQKDITDRNSYNQALQVLNDLKNEWNGLAAIWSGI